MKYQCPYCKGIFTTPCVVRSAQCPYCDAMVEMSNLPAPIQEGLFEPGSSGKSRGIAGVLAICFGGWGAHYFYLGKVKAGFACLAVMILLFSLFGLLQVFTIIQGIRMLRMSQEEFENRYVYNAAAFPF